MVEIKGFMYEVIVVGGGLSGLINGIKLARSNHRVLLIEKKSYPFQRVCGEYISNEVKPFLDELGCFPTHLGPSEISRFQLTSVSGKSVEIPLDLGGFGVSRYSFDQFLAEKAMEEGVTIKTQTSVSKVTYHGDDFSVFTTNGDSYKAKIVIGAYGKRSVLDKSLNRKFMKERSPYVGVKYHIKSSLKKDLVALHNFKGGYCGISQIEDGKFNLCYLASREVLKKAGNIPAMEKNILMKNPWLHDIFQNSEFLMDTPEVINEISFARKEPVFNHILMPGDSAGMIAPLCGNGMAMAIHGAKISSELASDYLQGKINRTEMEYMYTSKWNHQFAKRLWIGRNIQKLFGSGQGSEFAVGLLQRSAMVSRIIIRNTHGSPF